MNYRILGKTGFKISEVSLGTWQLGGKWGEKFNLKQHGKYLKNLLKTALIFLILLMFIIMVKAR